VPFPASAASASSSQTSIAVSTTEAVGTAVWQPILRPRHNCALHRRKSGICQLHMCLCNRRQMCPFGCRGDDSPSSMCISPRMCILGSVQSLTRWSSPADGARSEVRIWDSFQPLTSTAQHDAATAQQPVTPADCDRGTSQHRLDHTWSSKASRRSAPVALPLMHSQDTQRDELRGTRRFDRGCQQVSVVSPGLRGCTVMQSSVAGREVGSPAAEEQAAALLLSSPRGRGTSPSLASGGTWPRYMAQGLAGAAPATPAPCLSADQLGAGWNSGASSRVSSQSSSVASAACKRTLIQVGCSAHLSTSCISGRMCMLM